MKEAPVILPGSTIGVLGGGQLGRMIALAGRAMGYRFITLDPTPDCPCAQVSDAQIVAAYDDQEAARRLAERSDLITYEFENVDAFVAAMLSECSYVPQGSALLYTTQHRLREKKALQDAGVPVAPYRAITDRDSMQSAMGEIGLPAVLKTCSGGYDGKGQRVIRDRDEAIQAYEQLAGSGQELVLEQWIPFDKELSVIAARTPSGAVRTFPPAENVHVENILHLSIVPARISREIAEKAEALAVRIAQSLNVVGLIAVEMFLTADGQLYVNELAPRPHNSGHYTMDACATSQFEQHVRAVCHLPLGSTRLLSPVVMVNILGQHVPFVLQGMKKGLFQAEGLEFKIHLYGKKEAKPQRKMGHINILTDDVETALEWVRTAPVWRDIYGSNNGSGGLKHD